METLLNVEEAAWRINVRVRFIRRLIAEGRIPHHKLGRHVRIASTDLDAFVAAGRVEFEQVSLRRNGEGGHRRQFPENPRRRWKMSPERAPASYEPPDMPA